MKSFADDPGGKAHPVMPRNETDLAHDNQELRSEIELQKQKNLELLQELEESSRALTELVQRVQAYN